MDGWTEWTAGRLDRQRERERETDGHCKIAFKNMWLNVIRDCI
jgi:hypothetical protein